MAVEAAVVNVGPELLMVIGIALGVAVVPFIASFGWHLLKGFMDPDLK